MTKSYINPNLTISCAKHVFIPILLINTGNFCLLYWHYAQCFSHPITVEPLLSGPHLSGYLSYPDDKPDAKNINGVN